jgi:hypothetical protein
MTNSRRVGLPPEQAKAANAAKKQISVSFKNFIQPVY